MGLYRINQQPILKTHPFVADIWHPIKNLPSTLDDISYGMGTKFWWICKQGHEWLAAPNHLFSGKGGCPYCSKRRPSRENNLAIRFPDLTLEWNFSKNNLSPEEFSPFSNKKAWWICLKCQSEWLASICSRTNLKSGCPYCVGRKINHTNSLASIRPDLIEEWDFSKNDILPDQISVGGTAKVWWKCKKGHSWKTLIKHRVGNHSGCPQCCKGVNISKPSQQWLDIYQVALDDREISLKINDKKMRVDGIDFKTNTVYEFLGDFWHGNPKVFNSNDINPMNKKSYGELYRQSMNKIALLRQVGYNVIYIWESDFNSEEGVI